MLSSHYGTWWVKQTPKAKPCTVHDKFAMESEGAVWYCWNVARVLFSSCYSFFPNERFAATARVGPTYWDVQVNIARSRRGKLWADVTGYPCKTTRGGQRHEIRSSQLLNATKDCPSIFVLQRDAKGLQHPLQFNAGPFATSRRQSRSQQLPSFRSSRAPSTSTAFNNNQR